MSELDLLLNSLPDVPDAPPNPNPQPQPDVVPDQIPENVTQDLRDLDSVLTDLPRVPDAAPGAALTPDQLLASLPDVPDTPLGPPRTPEELRLPADSPDVPEGSPWQTSGDGSGGSPSGRAGDTEQGNRSPNDLDRLLQERMDRLKNQQRPDPDAMDADLAARLAKLREGGPDDLGRPARVDELREQYHAALEEEGTGGAGTPNATGGTAAAPQRPAPTASTVTAPNSVNGQGGSRPQSPAGTNPDGLDASLPDVPRDPPGSRPAAAADETDLVFPDVPQQAPAARPEARRTESDGAGTVTDDPPSSPRTESTDELPFPDGFDDGGDLDALLTLLDGAVVVTDDPLSRLAQLPDVPEGLSSVDRRKLAADTTRETDALLADARRVGVGRETRQRLGERIQDDVRAGRHAEAAEGLRELSDLVAQHGLGERLQQFRRHMDGGYEGRAAQLGMRRTEWLRHGLDIEEAALNGDPRRTTRLLDDFEQRLGALGSELKDRADHSPEALKKRLADNRRADAEAAGMDRERFRAWEDRLEQAATPDELQKTLADYEAELETARRLTTLRELGASEKELASWKVRFEGPGRGSDLDVQYERRTTALHGEAEVAALRERVSALYEGEAPQQGPSQPPPPHEGTGDDHTGPSREQQDGGPSMADLQQRLDAIHRGNTSQQEPPQPTPPPHDGTNSDNTPASDRAEGSGTENDASLEARLENMREGDDRTGLSREEQQQWADRHARAEDDAARQAVERQHAERMAQVERDRRLKAVSVGGPEGARRSPEHQDAWRRRLDEAADDPQAVDRVLDDYDAETDKLRREGKERLEQELRAPDRLRDLDRRIDRSLDRLPEEVRTQAARDARTLVERLRDLTAVPEETPAPKTDDAVPEQSAAQDTDPLRPTPAPYRIRHRPVPHPHPRLRSRPRPRLRLRPRPRLRPRLRPRTRLLPRPPARTATSVAAAAPRRPRVRPGA